MRMMVVALVFAFILSAGCFGSQPQVNQNSTNTSVTPPANNTTPEMPANPPNNTTPPPSVPNSTSPAPPPQQVGAPGTTQADCSTLTPDCGSCIAKAGCGWCKSSNSCLHGDANGPVSGQCQPSDWAATTGACQAPTTTVGSKCADQYNCAFCLSGNGCEWCIQGAKCVDAGSTDSCLGGWLNQSYQCNYASR